MNKYIIQKSTHPGYWVLTDTEHGIVLTFEDGRFNETQKVTVLDDVPNPSPADLARIMSEMGDWVTRHHGSKCFSHVYGYETSEDESKTYLYRRKFPRWRLKLQEDRVTAESLASSLRKAAEFLIKGNRNER